MNKEMQKIKDFESLKQIVKGKIKIQELDEELKQRLIVLCDDRTKQIRQKIEKQKNYNN